MDLKNKLIKVISGKGKKNRVVPLNNKIYRLLKKYLSIRNRTSDQFFTTNKSQSLSPVYVNMHLKKATEKLKWSKHITAHILRHSFASALVKENAPLPAIQSLLGHSDLRVTSIYIHQNLEQLQDAVNLI